VSCVGPTDQGDGDGDGGDGRARGGRVPNGRRARGHPRRGGKARGERGRCAPLPRVRVRRHLAGVAVTEPWPARGTHPDRGADGVAGGPIGPRGDGPVAAPGRAWRGQGVAAWQAVQHGEPVLAVADDQERFLDLIPPERMLTVLLWEHDEDMARVGGFLHDAGAARWANSRAGAPSILAPAPLADPWDSVVRCSPPR